MWADDACCIKSLPSLIQTAKPKCWHPSCCNTRLYNEMHIFLSAWVLEIQSAIDAMKKQEECLPPYLTTSPALGNSLAMRILRLFHLSLIWLRFINRIFASNLVLRWFHVACNSVRFFEPCDNKCLKAMIARRLASWVFETVTAAFFSFTPDSVP